MGLESKACNYVSNKQDRCASVQVPLQASRDEVLHPWRLVDLQSAQESQIPPPPPPQLRQFGRGVGWGGFQAG